jgi:regulator of protease activity HflC (stomatin/prohibitin superfamily)
MEIAIVLFVIAIIFVAQSVKVVPQQHAWVKERLGKYAGTLTPGLNFLMPFVDRVPTSTASRKSRWTCPARSASRATTRSCRWTASCTSR